MTSIRATSVIFRLSIFEILYARPNEELIKDVSPPTFALRLQPNDAFQGFYTITTNFSIGTPWASGDTGERHRHVGLVYQFRCQ
jgi:hypothetical protein